MDLSGKYRLKVMNEDVIPQSERMVVCFSALRGAGAPAGRRIYRIHAKVANVMNGEITDGGGILKGVMMTTLMMGTSLQSRVEEAIGDGFASGFRYKLTPKQLKLFDSQNVLIFEVLQSGKSGSSYN